MAKVYGKSEVGKKIEATVNGFDFVLDNPEVEGPTPGSFLALSLAGCKAMVAKGYFNGRGKEDVIIHIDVETNIKEDRKDASLAAKVELTVEGDVTEEEINRMEEIVEGYCTIQNVLESENNTIETKYSKI